MPTRCRTKIITVVSALIWCFVSTIAFAQAPWPTKPITFVVPFGGGSVLDTLIRAIQSDLSVALGQPVIVITKSGAGGTIGSAYVASAPADGYTFLVAANAHHISGALYPNLNYHPRRDFTAAASIGTTGYVMMVSASIQPKTVGEFIVYAKAKPGLVYASAGNGSATHLSMALFANMAHLDMLHVPFKSTGDGVLEVLAGRADATSGANIAMLAFKDDPRVRLLGVTTAKRSRFLPDVPTFAESGLPGYDFDSWLGILAPVATPKDILNRLNAEVDKLMLKPEVLERLYKLGIEPTPLSVDQFNAVLDADYVRMAELVKIAGAKSD